MKNSVVFSRVAERLLQVAAPTKRVKHISCDTEVYRDLGIQGDDFFELLLWINKEFGVEMNLNWAEYVPGEWECFFILRFLKNISNWHGSQYKSLRVHDIIAAIETKRWHDMAGTDRL